MKSQNHLVLFAKFWEPGYVKTRLSKKLGIQAAANVYFAFLDHLLSELNRVGDRRTVCFFPHQRRNEFFQLWGQDWELRPQSEGDLGNKLKSFFQAAFVRTPEFQPDVAVPFESETKQLKIVAIGSDCPLVDSATIESAFLSLDEQPIVLGPSSDGGYYLIGMREPLGEIFDRISWSTPAVLQQTIAILQQRKMGFDLLPEMRDVDEWEDWQDLLVELTARLARSDGSAIRLEERLNRLEVRLK